VVRTLQLAAVRAFLEGLDLQAVVAATHAALRGRCFSLGDGHDISCNLKLFETNRQTRICRSRCRKRLARPPRRRLFPFQKGQENLLPEGASTPDGVGCRIGRGYSVFARKGNPRGMLA